MTDAEQKYAEENDQAYRRRIHAVFCMWNARLLRSSYAHYLAARRCESLERYFSVWNICSAIAVLLLSADEALADAIANLLNVQSALMVPVLSVFVVFSSAIQYMRQYASRAALHKQAGNEYSNLRRKLERYWSKGNFHPEAVHSLNRSYNMISKSPPLVPTKIWISSAFEKKSEIDNINRIFCTIDDASSLESVSEILTSGGLDTSATTEEKMREERRTKSRRRNITILVLSVALVISLLLIHDLLPYISVDAPVRDWQP